MRSKLRAIATSSLIAFACTFCLSVLVASAPACAHLGNGGGEKQVNWPAYVECAPDIADIAPTVARVLTADEDDRSISSRGKRELRDLAIAHGPKTVACLIARFVSDWTSPGAAQDPLVTAGAARGRAFLAEVGTSVRLTDEDEPAFRPSPY